MDTNVPPSAITAINGMRVMSMWWVILGHVYGFQLVAPISKYPLAFNAMAFISNQISVCSLSILLQKDFKNVYSVISLGQHTSVVTTHLQSSTPLLDDCHHHCYWRNGYYMI